MGRADCLYAAGATSVLHRLPENGGFVRGVRGGLPAELHEPERAADARRVGNGDVVDAGGAQALFTYRGAARRRRAARASRHEADRQRGRGAARLRGDRGRGWGGVAWGSSRPLRGAASVRAVDSRRRYDGEAALWPPGRRCSWVQSTKARTTEPLL